MLTNRLTGAAPSCLLLLSTHPPRGSVWPLLTTADRQIQSKSTTTVSSQTPLHGHGALARMGLAEYGNAVELPGTSILLVSWYLQ